MHTIHLDKGKYKNSDQCFTLIPFKQFTEICKRHKQGKTDFIQSYNSRVLLLKNEGRNAYPNETNAIQNIRRLN